jgi:hypothetical protein
VPGVGSEWVCLWCLALTQMCDTCGKGDREEWLLLCSSPGCRGACHTFCHSPMMHHVPDSDWFCMQCCRERDSKKQKRRLSIPLSPVVKHEYVEQHHPPIDVNQLIGLLKQSSGFPFRFRLLVAANNTILSEALQFGCGFSSVTDAQLYSTAMLQASFGYRNESSWFGISTFSSIQVLTLKPLNTVTEIYCAIYDKRSERLILQHPKLKGSSRFQRMFPNLKILRVTFDFGGYNDGVSFSWEPNYQCFEVCGVEFSLLYLKSVFKAVYVSLASDEVEQLRSLLIPLELNRHLSTFKYNARFGLYFSDTQPTITVPFEGILFEQDCVSAGTGVVLTDGCGLISPRLFRACLERMTDDAWQSVECCAFQARIGSAKGVFVRSCQNLPEGIDLVIRESQIKFELARPWESKYCVMEIVNRLHHSVAHHGCVLNTQAIAVLTHLGVKQEVFVDYQRRAMDSLFATMFGGSHKELLKVLWDDAKYSRSTDGYRAFQMVAMKFAAEPMLQKWLKDIFTWKLNNVRERHHILVPQSMTLLMVPDPTRTLLPNECFIALGSSYDDAVLDSVQRVAVLRNPAMCASDVQVFNLKRSVELTKLKNVLVLSTHPDCIVSPAHLLSGGDYDGDRALVIFDPAFLPASVTKRNDEMLIDVGAYGHVNQPPISEKMTGTAKVLAACRFFGRPEQQGIVGRLSTIWQNLCLETNCNLLDPRLVRVGRLAEIALDAFKQGVWVSLNVLHGKPTNGESIFSVLDLEFQLHASSLFSHIEDDHRKKATAELKWNVAELGPVPVANQQDVDKLRKFNQEMAVTDPLEMDAFCLAKHREWSSNLGIHQRMQISFRMYCVCFDQRPASPYVCAYRVFFAELMEIRKNQLVGVESFLYFPVDMLSATRLARIV